jgi:hypothetical protein
MDDSETSQMLDELKAFVSSGSWDLSFLDDDNLAGQEFRSSLNNMQQSPDTFRQTLEQTPQFSAPLPPSRKRKRCNSLDPPISDLCRASLPPQTKSVVVYDAKGRKRGGGFHE